MTKDSKTRKTLHDTIAADIVDLLSGITFVGTLPEWSALKDESFDRLSKHIGKHEYINLEVLRGVLNDILFDKLKHRIKASTVVRGPLSPTEVDDIATSFADKIITIPFDYHVLMPLPKSDVELKTVTLTPNIEIMRLKGKEHKKYAPSPRDKAATSLLQALSTLTDQDQDPGERNFIRIKLKGYITTYGMLQTRGSDPLFYYKVIYAYLSTRGMVRHEKINYQAYGKPGYAPSKYRYHIFSSNHAFVRHIIESFDDDMLREGSVIHNDDDRVHDVYDHGMNVLGKLLTEEKESKPEAYRHKFLLSLYWFYESLKASEAPQQAIAICSCIDALFEESGETEKDKSKYATWIKCELIAQAIAANITHEQFIKDNLIGIIKYRNRVVHGSEQIDSTHKFGHAGIPRLVEINEVRRFVAMYLVKRIDKFYDLKFDRFFYTSSRWLPHN